MEFGVRLPASGASLSLDNVLTVVEWAEELGYHSVWLGDHVAFPDQVDSFYPYDAEHRWRIPANSNMLDPLLVLAWVANAGPNLKLGTSVMIAPLRQPILLAKQLATLDFLSKGRVIFGVGVGFSMGCMPDEKHRLHIDTFLANHF